MSFMKRYLEEHANDYADVELIDMGYSKEDIEIFRESFPKSEKIEDT